MALKLEILLHNPDGPSVVRDAHDRVYVGPITPPFGVSGRAYYLNVSTGMKVTASQVSEVVNAERVEVPVENEEVRRCEQCGGKMPADAHHKSKYCCERCRNMARLERKGKD